MSTESSRDPRTAIVREKYFSLRPKPLEKWLWAAKAPGSAERVFWYHWDIGHQNGSWVSQVPLRIVAKECGIDVGTVTRAYQWLKARGLVRRQDVGRDDANPFRQATALTEVFVPRDLVKRLAAEPNRGRREGRAQTPFQRHASPPVQSPSSDQLAPASPSTTAAAALSRRESRLIFQKLSEGERTRFYAGHRERKTELEFDADTRLGEAERLHVLETLRLISGALPTTTTTPISAAPKRARQRLSVLQLAEARQRLLKAKGEGDSRDANELRREIAWSVEEGSLARFEARHGIAIACKKVREGAWATPYGMPVDWSWRRASPEPCAAAGRN